MANGLIELIKVLRDRTGAGLMDCKSALLACDSDVEKALDWLREKGIAKVAKKSGRIAAEGLALTRLGEKENAGDVIILEVNCETDFVARGDAFHELVNNVADLLLSKKPDSLAKAQELTSVLFTDATVKLGEKLALRRFEILHKNNDEMIATYIHMGGKIAVAVILSRPDDVLGKQLAMHIASNNPTYNKVSDIPQDVVAHEKEVELSASQNDEKLKNKPTNVLEKIIAGKVKKYFSELTLEEQAFLIDDSKTVSQILKENNLDVIHFVRYQVGEGMTKREEDFAKEVMSQTK